MNKMWINVAAVVILINSCFFSIAGIYHVMIGAGISEDFYLIPLLWLIISIWAMLFYDERI